VVLLVVVPLLASLVLASLLRSLERHRVALLLLEDQPGTVLGEALSVLADTIPEWELLPQD
jgi:hypothetical protein